MPAPLLPLPLYFYPTEPLPEVVVNGVLQGFYGFSTSSASAQPKADCYPLTTMS
jgi:hypothetical protein